MITRMFNLILAALTISYKISISPKDFGSLKMDKDLEEETKKYWNNYLNSEYSSEDFFTDTPEELMEKQQVFANPTCSDCSKETFSLLTDGENNIISKCPECRRTYKTCI